MWYGGDCRERAFFDYSAERPPDIEIAGTGARASPATPAEAGRSKRFAAILVLHPGPGSRAAFLAGMGAVSLLVDAPLAERTVAAWGRAVTDPGGSRAGAYPDGARPSTGA
ncbi:MAG TPA: hypothetical protein PLD13_00870 [Methanoculleus sp.]|nr:hypothetical protein [Methanoculleus sp.]